MRYYVERVKCLELPHGWEYELRDRLIGTNGEPMAYFRDIQTADQIAAVLNTLNTVHVKTSPALSRAARRVLEHA